MKLVINRPNWLHGEGSEESYLFRPEDGKMCCLGFYGVACGLSQTTMEERLSFSDIPLTILKASGIEKFAPLLKDLTEKSGLLLNNSRLALNLMIENDARSRVSREDTITELFASMGVEVTFTDEPLPTV